MEKQRSVADMLKFKDEDHRAVRNSVSVVSVGGTFEFTKAGFNDNFEDAGGVDVTNRSLFDLMMAPAFRR